MLRNSRSTSSERGSFWSFTAATFQVWSSLDHSWKGKRPLNFEEYIRLTFCTNLCFGFRHLFTLVGLRIVMKESVGFLNCGIFFFFFLFLFPSLWVLAVLGRPPDLRSTGTLQPTFGFRIFSARNKIPHKYRNFLCRKAKFQPLHLKLNEIYWILLTIILFTPFLDFHAWFSFMRLFC